MYKKVLALLLTLTCMVSPVGLNAGQTYKGKDYKPFQSNLGGWGYKGPTGEVWIYQYFRQALPFEGELAPISVDGRTFGLIAPFGTIMVAPVFDGIPKWCGGGLFVVKGTDGMMRLHDVNGKRLNESGFSNLGALNGIIYGQKPGDGKFYFFDGAFNVSSPGFSAISSERIFFEKIRSFKHLMLFKAVTEQGELLYVNPKGEDIFNGRFHSITPLKNDQSSYLELLNILQRNEIEDEAQSCIFYAKPAGKKKFGVYTIGGRELLQPKYGNIKKASQEFLKKIKKDLKAEVTSKQLASELFEDMLKIDSLSESIAAANLSTLGVSGPTEEFELKVAMPSLGKGEFKEEETKKATKKTTIAARKGKKGRKGKKQSTQEKAPFYFSNDITEEPFNSERFAEMNDCFAYFFCRKPGQKKYLLYNGFGRRLTTDEYDELQTSVMNPDKDFVIRFRKGNKWGLMNQFGEILLPPVFDELAGNWAGKIAKVKRGDKFYLMNTSTLKLVNNIPYDYASYWDDKHNGFGVKYLGYDTYIGLDGKAHPSIPEIEFEKAHNCYGEPEEKIEQYFKVINMSTNDDRHVIGDCYNSIASIYYEQKDFYNAGRYLKKALEFGSKYAKGNIEIVNAAIERSRQQENRLSEYRQSQGNGRQSFRSRVQAKQWREELGWGGFVIVKQYPNGLVQRTRYRLCINCQGSMICRVCYGSGRCSVCNGNGGIVSAGLGNFYQCFSCGTTGRCHTCGGTGECLCTRFEYPGYCIASMTTSTLSGEEIYHEDADYSDHTSHSHSEHASSGNKTVCPDCGGTRLWRKGAEPEYGRPRSECVGYYNPIGEKCPHCEHLTEHWHTKCITCMHMYGTENPYR